MNLVLDSSLALSWCFENEATEATQEVLESLVTGTAFVPSLWWWEVNNSLCMSQRKGRITAEWRIRMTAMLTGLRIEEDEFSLRQVPGEIARLAIKHDLTVYDATYLEMAIRLALPLGSLDKPLRAAAHKTKVPCLPAKV